MMTIGDMSNIKDTILDLWNTQAWIAMIIDDMSNNKDIVWNSGDTTINNDDHSSCVEQ